MSTLLTQLFQDGQATGSITPQDMRDLIVSVQKMFLISDSPSYDNDADAATGGIAVGQVYRNGNFLMVRLS